MRRVLLIWGLPTFLYGAFFAWYTNLAGPLTQEEIEIYMSRLAETADDPARLEQMRLFMEEDTGRAFIMVNAIEMRPTPTPLDGVEAGETSEQVLAKYMAYMWPALLSRASHPLVVGPAVSDAMDLEGIEGGETWSSGAMMRYRSRRDLLEIATSPEFDGRHDFKVAAMRKTIAYPIEPAFNLADPRLLLGFLLLAVAALLNAFARRRT